AKARQLAHDIPVRQRHAFVFTARDRDVDGARFVTNEPDIGVPGWRSGADRNGHSVDADLRSVQPRRGHQVFYVAKPVANRIGRTVDHDLRREGSIVSKTAFIAHLALRKFGSCERVLPTEINPTGDTETECENVRAIADCRETGIGRRTGRTALTREKF